MQVKLKAKYIDKEFGDNRLVPLNFNDYMVTHMMIFKNDYPLTTKCMGLW